MDPAVTTTLHLRSFSCEFRHYREIKLYQMNNSPRVKSFHSETFFYYLLDANPTICLDQELIYQLFDFFMTFIFLKTSSLHSTTAVDLEGFVIRIFFNLEEAY